MSEPPFLPPSKATRAVAAQPANERPAEEAVLETGTLSRRSQRDVAPRATAPVRRTSA
jgi:hypothetical protein